MLDVKLANFLGTDTSNYRPSSDPKDEAPSIPTKNIARGQSAVSLKDKETVGAKPEVADAVPPKSLKGQKPSNVSGRLPLQKALEPVAVNPKIRGDRVRGSNRRAPSEKVSSSLFLFNIIFHLSPTVKALNRYQLKLPAGTVSSKADYKTSDSSAADYKSFKLQDGSVSESDQKSYHENQSMAKSFKGDVSDPIVANETYEEDFEEDYEEEDEVQEEVVEEVYEVRNENDEYIDYIEEPVDDTVETGVKDIDDQPEEKSESSLTRSQKVIRPDGTYLGKTVSTKRQYQNQVDIIENERFASSSTRRSDILPSMEPKEPHAADGDADLWKSVWKNRDANEVDQQEEEEESAYQDGIELDVSRYIS